MANVPAPSSDARRYLSMLTALAISEAARPVLSSAGELVE